MEKKITDQSNFWDVLQAAETAVSSAVARFDKDNQNASSEQELSRLTDSLKTAIKIYITAFTEALYQGAFVSDPTGLMSGGTAPSIYTKSHPFVDTVAAEVIQSIAKALPDSKVMMQ